MHIFANACSTVPVKKIQIYGILLYFSSIFTRERKFRELIFSCKILKYWKLSIFPNSHNSVVEKSNGIIITSQVVTKKKSWLNFSYFEKKMKKDSIQSIENSKRRDKISMKFGIKSMHPWWRQQRRFAEFSSSEIGRC